MLHIVSGTVYCNAAIAGAAAMRQASLPIAFRSELKEVTVEWDCIHSLTQLNRW